MPLTHNHCQGSLLHPYLRSDHLLPVPQKKGLISIQCSTILFANADWSDATYPVQTKIAMKPPRQNNVSDRDSALYPDSR